MSRLTELIEKAKANDPQLAADLEREFKALSSRLSFGLNFERHRPEAVELPQRQVRRGDKVRVLPERGSTKKGDQRLWRVTKLVKDRKGKKAELERLGDPEEQATASVDDIVVVAEFRDTIYPGLVSTGKVSRGKGKPWHTVINGENYHALKALTWTHRGAVDAIYIDPPYNTGAKDWKYNNDYVEGEDLYRHSKWLAMMERRLHLAKQLLNPADSVLIVTIDEKEYLRLGLLLEQTFPEAQIQMISTIIKPEGTNRAGEFSRTNEFIYFVMFGEARVDPTPDDMTERKEVGKNGPPIEWRNLRRRENTSTRDARPNQFYAVFVDPERQCIHSVGDALALDVDRESVTVPRGCYAVFPVKPDGTEMLWGLRPEGLRSRLKQGFARVSKPKVGPKKAVIQYLARGTVLALASGEVMITGRDDQGAVKGYFKEAAIMPKTTWSKSSHNAQTAGTLMLSELIPGRRFPFPKSLYAVEDSLRFFIADRPEAVVLDFFSGSGTTAHAVMRLNRQDGGHRQCISITNNEVGADEQKALREEGLRPGDAEWEQFGICDYITKPRIEAAITGTMPDGNPINGAYKFGFRSDVEKPRRFLHIAFADRDSFASSGARKQLVALIDQLPQKLASKASPYIVDDKHTASVLFDIEEKSNWLEALEGQAHIKDFYIVTTDASEFKALRDEVSDLLGPMVVNEEQEVPMSDGFEANAEFFTLTYETPISVNYQTAFARIAPLLWMRAGSAGQRIDKVPSAGWAVADTYGLLIELDKATDFLKAVRKAETLHIVYIVTDDERRFQALSRRMPEGVETIRLYESYLTNFAFANGDEA